MTISAILPIGAIDPLPGTQTAGVAGGAPPASFAQMLERGVATAEAKLAEADRLVAQFAIDDSVPLHRVTHALEEARISFELMLQVRNRLLEGTQQLLNMQF